MNSLPPDSTRLSVVIQQQVLPLYRIPFFEELGRHVDLTVALAANASIPGVTTVESSYRGTSFKIQWLPERRFLGRIHQEGILELLAATTPHVLVAGSGYLTYYFWHLPSLRRLRKLRIRLFTWGCDGYEFRSKDEWDKFRRATRRRDIHHRYLGRRLRTDVDGFIAYSHLTAAFWKNAYGVPGNRIFVAENALDSSAMEQTYLQVRKGALVRDDLRLVFVGRMVEGKNIDVLLRAFARARQQVSHAHLLIVGEGPARASLESLSTSLGLVESVRFAGGVKDRQSLAQVLSTSGAFVLPGYGGLAINEAMAAGLPVICSRGDGTGQHLVHNGENGFLVAWKDDHALADAMTELLSDPKRSRHMGQRSFELATQVYTLQKMTDKYVGALSAGLPGSLR